MDISSQSKVQFMYLGFFVALCFILQAQAFTSTSSIHSRSISRQSANSLGMFTGIVEEIGTVVSLEERDDMILWDGSKGKGTELTVQGGVVLDGAYLG